MNHRWTGLAFGILAVLASSAGVVKAQPCVLPDNGTGTVTLPPAGCGYLSPDDVHELLVGLPIGTSIQIAAEHEFFFCLSCVGGPNDGQPCTPAVGCPAPGICTDGNSTCSFPTTDGCNRQGPGGGEMECAESTLTLEMRGTGALDGYSRMLSLPVEFETHVGPRIPGQPVQSFDTDMFRLQGQLPIGDPDFDLLRIRGGTDFNMPSPGHTTLTRQGPPGSPFVVDSFFDIFYEIEFIGAPGGPFAGMSGSTTATIRMQTGGPFGACCTAAGCQITAQTQCTGSWLGAGVLCTPDPCIGNPPCGDGICDSIATGENSCTCPTDCGPATTSETGLCNDGSDNDCDQLTDCQDPDCASEAGSCTDGLDNDCDLAIDCADPDCDTDPACGAVCEPNSTLTACNPTQCPIATEECLAHCGKLNPFTGQVTVLSCDCRQLNECHLTIPQPPGPVAGPGGNPCVVLDNGGGTVTLPPAGCDYLSPDEVHKIIDGLPAGTEIHLAPIHKDFICNEQGTINPVCSFQTLVDCDEAGGSLGGEKECAESNLQLDLSVLNPPCPGPLCGWTRQILVPMGFETHTGPRTPGNPVQSFDTDMFRMFGQISNIGDPDFDLLRVVGGTDFGMPSPGHTTLTKLPGGPQWAVDSFFDITYRIDFVGAPGGRLAGRSGSTTATIRMQTGTGATCEGGCPAGFVCEETRVVNADGTINLCCDCIPSPVCAPNATGTACNPVICPDTGTGVIDTCQKKCAILDPLTGDVTLSDCDCAGPNECHMEIATPAAGGPVAGAPPSSGNCVAVDDGTGTVKLPPDGCPYLSPDEFHVIFAGLPPGVNIEIGAIHKDFICNRQPGSSFCSFPIPPGVDCDDEEPNDPTDGAKECADSTLELHMSSNIGANTAGPGWTGVKMLPVKMETHTGPRTPGMPVQSFDTDMFRLQGEMIGDPDFDLLRIRAGTDFSMPSPGHTTLTKLPGGPNWAVDSFFDVFYEIEFIGAPGGPFSGMSGSTTGTIRMQTNAYRCVGDCPPDTDCVEKQTTQADGTIKICCECEAQPPQVCQPLPDRSGCTDTNCPCFGECIGGSYCDDTACCLDPNNCPVCYAPNSQESIKLCGDCFGECIGGSYCESGLPGCSVVPGAPVCYVPNHHYSIYLCSGCLGECIDGKYCDHPNPDCCLEPGNCQCYPATHPNSLKLCGGLDKCKPKCVKYNQLTGQVTVEQCDCVGEECYVKIGNPVVTAGPGAACEVADNGSGSVDLPPAGCEYLTADEVHKIIDGLPAGTEIHLAPIHKDFICHKGQQGGVCSFPLGVDCREDGGDLGGEKECSDSTLEFQLTGTGTLLGWNRIVTIPNTSFETHIGKKKPFEPVQSFPTQMHRLFGQISNIGDPDFDLLRIVAGNDFALPSPGHTTLTKLPIGPNWAVDSFFDITYRIDFVGNPASLRIAGRSGSTTGTIRMATPTKFKCSTDCPAGQTCVQTTTQLRSCALSGAPCDDTPLGICPVGDTCIPNGSMTVCCDCVDTQVCEPKPDKKSCTNNTCPPGVTCKLKKIRCYPAPDPRGCEIEECECLDADPCHPEMPTGTATVPTCTGACPATGTGNNKCVRKKQPVPGQNGVFDYSCRCVPVHNKPIAADTSVPGKNRHLSVAYDGTPSNTAGPGVALAMRVLPTDLQRPCPPNLPQFPPPNFSMWDTSVNGVCVGGSRAGHPCRPDNPNTCTTDNPDLPDCPGGACGPATGCSGAGEGGGCARWAGRPGTFLEWNDFGVGGGTYRASRLQCSPVFFDWSLETNVNVTGAEILPSSRYAAQFVDQLCEDTLDEDCFSEALVLGAARSGDITGVFNPPGTTTQPDALDVAQVVNKVKQIMGAPSKSISQMQPNAPEPLADVSALDVVAVVDAVRQLAYAFSGPCPCPSLSTCNSTACATDAVCIALPAASGGGAGAKCVKTCVGGTNAGEVCINNSHCPGGLSCGEMDATPGYCRDRCVRCKP